MTLPSYVAGSNVNSATGTSANTRGVNRSAAWVAGTLVIVAIWRGTGEAFTSVPTGWTQVSGSPFQLGTAGDYVAVFWKIMQSSGEVAVGSGYTWSWTTATWTEVLAAAWQDTDQTNPLNQVSGQSNSSSTTITCPAVTPTVSNTLIVCIGAFDNDTSYTANTGLTERLDFGGWAITFADETGPASGVSTSTNTFTAAGGAFANAGVTLLLQEVGGGPSPTTLLPGTIATGATLFNPTVTLASAPATLLPGTISSAATLFAPTVIQLVQPGTIASAQQLYAPTVTLSSAPQTVQPGTVATAQQLFPPIVFLAIPQTVQPGFIASGQQVFAPLFVGLVQYSLEPDAIPSLVAVFEPRVGLYPAAPLPMAYTLEPPHHGIAARGELRLQPIGVTSSLEAAPPPPGIARPGG